MGWSNIWDGATMVEAGAINATHILCEAKQRRGEALCAIMILLHGLLMTRGENLLYSIAEASIGMVGQ